MDDELYQRLLAFSLNYISIRPRSEHEIRTYIVKKINSWKIPPMLLGKVIDRLNELGYIDDLRFARAFIDSMNRSRPKGAMRIRMELKKKGVDGEIIEKARELVKVDEKGNDMDLARIAATKKLRGLNRYDRMAKRSKLYGFLSRRGFDHTTISSVIDEMFPKVLQ